MRFNVAGDVTSKELVVGAPVTGHRAERTGVLPGERDVIVAMDGVSSTNGLGLYEAVYTT